MKLSEETECGWCEIVMPKGADATEKECSLDGVLFYVCADCSPVARPKKAPTHVYYVTISFPATRTYEVVARDESEARRIFYTDGDAIDTTEDDADNTILSVELAKDREDL